MEFFLYLFLFLFTALAICLLILLESLLSRVFKKRTAVRANYRRSDREEMRFRPWPEVFDEIRAEAFPDIDAMTLQTLFEKYRFTFSKMHEFAFDPPDAVVDELIVREFQGCRVEQVRALLTQYKNFGPAIPDGRIYVDILKASERNLDRIPNFVKQANVDFRDVLMIAEAPALTPAIYGQLSSSLRRGASPQEAVESLWKAETLRKVANTDLRQFVAWLLDTDLPPTTEPPMISSIFP